MSLVLAPLAGAPLMLHPPEHATFTEAVALAFSAQVDAPAPIAQFRGSPVRTSSGATLYNRAGHAAIIPVHGTLVNRGAWFGSRFGVTSYEGLVGQLKAALADKDVARIILDLDTPGGEATGAFEAAAQIRAIDARKPVTAVVNGMAASAGYALASGARRIVVAPSAIVGSIGVLAVHIDRSGALAKAGLKPTLIHAGARKVDGSSVQPLSTDAKSSLQADVDRLHTMFVDLVAQHRKLASSTVRATEAGVFMGAHAVKALADAVGTLDDVLGSAGSAPAAPGRHSPSTPPPSRSFTMPVSTALPAAKPPIDPARLAAIKALPEAIGNDTMAEALARDTTLTVAAASKVMRDLQAVQARERAQASAASWDDAYASLNAKDGPITRTATGGAIQADQLAYSASLEAESRRVARMTPDQRRAYANAKYGTGAPAQPTAAEKGWAAAYASVEAETSMGRTKDAPRYPGPAPKNNGWDSAIDHVNKEQGAPSGR